MPGEPRSVVVVVDRVSPYTLPVVTGIRDVLEQAGLPVLVHVNDYFAQGIPNSLAQRLRSGAFRGMVSLPLSTPEVHHELEQLLAAGPELVGQPNLHPGLIMQTPGSG